MFDRGDCGLMGVVCWCVKACGVASVDIFVALPWLLRLYRYWYQDGIHCSYYTHYS